VSEFICTLRSRLVSCSSGFMAAFRRSKMVLLSYFTNNSNIADASEFLLSTAACLVDFNIVNQN